jgi:hypothetical protein
LPTQEGLLPESIERTKEGARIALTVMVIGGLFAVRLVVQGELEVSRTFTMSPFTKVLDA